MAKRGVNADRAARHDEEMNKLRRTAQIEAEYASRPISHKPPSRKSEKKRTVPVTTASDHRETDVPSSIQDPTPDDDLVNKYLAKKPYISKKGDRFS